MQNFKSVNAVIDFVDTGHECNRTLIVCRGAPSVHYFDESTYQYFLDSLSPVDKKAFKLGLSVVTTIARVKSGINITDFDRICGFKLSSRDYNWLVNERNTQIDKKEEDEEDVEDSDFRAPVKNKPKKKNLIVVESVLDNKISPRNLSVLLHYSLCIEPHDVSCHDVAEAESFLETNGLLKGAGDEDTDESLIITEKGKAYIEAICNTPLPIASTIWTIPSYDQVLGRIKREGL